MGIVIMCILTIGTLVFIYFHNELTNDMLEIISNFVTFHLFGGERLLKKFPLRISRKPLVNWDKVKNFVEGERTLSLGKGFDIRYSFFSLGEAYLQLNYKFVLPGLLVLISLFPFVLALFKIMAAHANIYMALPLPIGAIMIAYSYNQMDFFNMKESKWEKSVAFFIVGLLLIYITKGYVKNL